MLINLKQMLVHHNSSEGMKCFCVYSSCCSHIDLTSLSELRSEQAVESQEYSSRNMVKMISPVSKMPPI